MNLTIVIPAYNAAGHLADSLRALEEFARAGVEILLIDDGSEDHTVEVFYAHTRDWPAARCVKADHRGLAATRNRGIVEASREFLAFMDSDDMLCLEGAKAMIQALQVSRAPAVRGGETTREAGQAPECNRGKATNRVLKADRAMLQGFGGTLRFIYRTDFLISKGLTYPEDVTFAEDLIFYVRFAIACPEFLDISVIYYCYTVGRVEQMTAQSRAASWDALPRALERCINEVESGGRNLQVSVAAMIKWYALRGLPQVDSAIRRSPRIELRRLAKTAPRRLGLTDSQVNGRLFLVILNRLCAKFLGLNVGGWGR